jgi:hypothetical protein
VAILWRNQGAPSQLFPIGGLSCSQDQCTVPAEVCGRACRWGAGLMSIFDSRIILLLDERLKASDQGRKQAADALLRLIRSGKADAAAINALAEVLGKRWGPEMKRYLADLKRQLELADQ